MLAVHTEFPHVGSNCYFDDVDKRNQPVVEPARILRDNGDGTALLSLTDRRYPGEVASGNRTVDFSRLRATEQPVPEGTAPRKRRGKGRQR